MGDWTFNATLTMENSTNTSVNASIDLPKTVSLIVIFVCSLLGNLCTVAIVSSFKQHKLPDVLVIGLACTDLIATFIPVPMSLYSYITLEQFDEGSFACKFYGTVAQFTRYSSVLIVTLISVERYFAVNQPFIYRNHATPRKCAGVLISCWVIAFALAITPAFGSHTSILSHDGFCLFDFSSNYAISILVYAGIQYCIVLVCFVLVTAKLLRVYRRRKQLQVQGTYNQRSHAREREHEVSFTRPKLTSRISDIGIAIKKAAPIFTERFQLGVEAQFARMLFAVVALFYVSWTTLVILMAIAQAEGTQGQSLVLFWGIRLSVISLALNPLLYGLLARQYRMAYLYVFKRIFSSCCPTCVKTPASNIFATARTPGGEPQGKGQATVQSRRMRECNYSNTSMNGSVWNGRPGLSLLTHTTHISLDLLPQLEEGDYEGQEESMHEHSTYIPSAGELSSTVIIPHQAQQINQNSRDIGVNSHPRASSDNNLTEPGPHEHQRAEGNSGSHNPLAIIADIQGESAVTDLTQPRKQFPPLEAIDPHDLNPGKIYANPIYNGREKNISRATPLSLLRSSKKSRLQAKYSRETGNDRQISSSSVGDTDRHKTSVEKTKSHPLLNSGKKKPKLRTTYTLPPTIHSGDSVEPGIVTSIDDLANVHNLLQVTSTPRHMQSNSAVRASARTYREMKVSSKQERPISSSQSFVDTPIADETALGVKGKGFTDVPVVDMAGTPRYQLSVSPVPPSDPISIPTPATESTTTPPPSFCSPSKSPISISQSFHPEQTQSSPTTIPTAAVLVKTSIPSPLSHSEDSFRLPQNTSHQLGSVKELCRRYESMSSTPPASPRSPTSSFLQPTKQNYTAAQSPHIP